MKPIFSRNDDISKMSFVNWRISDDEILNLINMADGFMLSSIELAKVCLNDNKDKIADIIIFPILANANHGIELYLKAIMWILNKLNDSESKIEGSHNIQQIYQTVRAKILSYGGQMTIKGFMEATLELMLYINELFVKINSTPKDDKMDFSRYPFSTKYESHFYVDEISNIEVDLENFVERFTIIHKKLDDLSNFLYHQELNQDW